MREAYEVEGMVKEEAWREEGMDMVETTAVDV